VIKTADPGLPLATDRLGRRLFTGLVISSSTLAGALVLPHQLIAGIILFAIAAVLLVLHTLRDRQRAAKTAKKDL
jgi:ABC-type dipeptide/oligopeptide/nickel transport system permease subunit